MINAQVISKPHAQKATARWVSSNPRASLRPAAFATLISSDPMWNHGQQVSPACTVCCYCLHFAPADSSLPADIHERLTTTFSLASLFYSYHLVVPIYCTMSWAFWCHLKDVFHKPESPLIACLVHSSTSECVILSFHVTPVPHYHMNNLQWATLLVFVTSFRFWPPQLNQSHLLDFSSPNAAIPWS